MAERGGKGLLVIRISASNATAAEFRKVRQAISGLGEESVTSGKKVGSLEGAFRTVGRTAGPPLKAVTAAIAAVGAGIATASAAVVALGQKGAAIDDVTQAFRSLSTSVGSTGDAMLGALRSGVKGTISDFDLMKVANKALGAGLLKTDDDARTLAEGARLLAKRTGGDTVAAFDTMLTAMASGRTAQLKQLGLFVDNKEAVKEFASATGKSVSDLTDADRAAALQAATLEKLREELERNAPPAADFGEIIDQGKVALENLTNKVAVMISKSPPLIAGMRAAGEAIGRAFGGDADAAVLAIVNAIERGALIALEFGRTGLTAAGFFFRGFSAIKAVVLGVALALSEGDKRIRDLAATTVELAAKLPGFGGQFQGLAQAVRASATASEEMNQRLREQAKDALVAAAGNDSFGRALKTAKGVLDEVKTSMVNQGLSQREANAATAEGVTQTNALGTSLGEINGKLVELSPVTIDWKAALAETRGEIEVFGTDASTAFQNTIAMTDAFGGSFQTVGNLTASETLRMSSAFAAFGLTTRTESQKTLDKMEEDFDILKRSGEATAKDLKKAWEDLEAARRAASQQSATEIPVMNDSMATGLEQIFGALGQKFKAAAIAGAIIATYQAIAKALASVPWPASLVAAAGAAAAGFANVAKIKASQPGFETGTRNLDFEQFGASGTLAVLHRREAIIPEGSGHLLAREMANEMSRGQADGSLLEAMERRFELALGRLDSLPRAIQRAVRDGVLLAS